MERGFVAAAGRRRRTHTLVQPHHDERQPPEHYLRHTPFLIAKHPTASVSDQQRPCLPHSGRHAPCRLAEPALAGTGHGFSATRQSAPARHPSAIQRQGTGLHLHRQPAIRHPMAARTIIGQKHPHHGGRRAIPNPFERHHRPADPPPQRTANPAQKPHRHRQYRTGQPSDSRHIAHRAGTV